MPAIISLITSYLVPAAWAVGRFALYFLREVAWRVALTFIALMVVEGIQRGFRTARVAVSLAWRRAFYRERVSAKQAFEAVTRGKTPVVIDGLDEAIAAK